jgi:hypothetical protein
MTFRVRIDPVALRQIEDFARYLRDYSDNFAIEQIDRLDRILRENLSQSPLTWSYFVFEAGRGAQAPPPTIWRSRSRETVSRVGC